MKKILSYFFTLNLAVLIGTSVVNAECSYTDKATLNKIAANVKVNYEILKEEVNPADYDLEPLDPSLKMTMSKINLNLYNISNEVIIEGTDSTTGETFTKTSTDAVEGIITISYTDLSMVRKYTFKVYGSDTSVCPGESLKTIYLTLPKKNEFYDLCNGDDNFYLCKEFVTVENVNYEDFYKKLDNYQTGKIDETGEKTEKVDKKWYEKVLTFAADYKYYIGGGVLVIIAGVVVIRRIKTKKQRELGL